MQRNTMNQLLEWKQSPYRKPLILEGVRQVGKTWLLMEFGRLHYENVAYINFEENPEYKELFENTKDIKRIIPQLATLTRQPIHPERTLLIFDEIQGCPDVLTSLKYFHERGSEYHVVTAGSLLGITLAQPTSFPVGKVHFLNLHPMTFTEFLLASGDENLASYLDSIEEIAPIPSPFNNPLIEKLKMYYVTGGMPDPVRIWTQDQNIEAMEHSLDDILSAYQRDFLKHPSISEFPKITLVWNSLPSQLSRENKKFMYKVVKEGARAREYENALEWLVNAHIVQKIYRSTAPRLPISAYDDISAFKLYYCDVGLLREHAKLHPSAVIEGNRLFTEHKGALTENYVLQALTVQYAMQPRYWTSEKSTHEVDFLLQHNNHILPVEVKADTNLTSKSLNKFAQLYPDNTPLRIRFSLANLSLDGDLLNIPLFMADHTKRLISLALEML